MRATLLLALAILTHPGFPWLPDEAHGPLARPEESMALPVSRKGISGQATWYRWRPGEAAAGPRLRAALGSRWRGRLVRVCAGESCLRVRLTDWCACPGERLVDLDRRAFARLAFPSRGVVRVTVIY